MLKGRNVLWQTDNYAASIIIKAGSNKNHLQLLAENIFKTSISKNIRLIITWIPREQNKVADSLCKINYVDWTTATQFFKHLSSIWGPFAIDRTISQTTQFFKFSRKSGYSHLFIAWFNLSSIWGPFTIDRFADNFNSKLPRFNSKYWFPGSENVNALAFSWENENNFLVPPVSVILGYKTHSSFTRKWRFGRTLLAIIKLLASVKGEQKWLQVICKGLSLIQQSNTLSRTRK